jgi:hypothetical protein
LNIIDYFSLVPIQVILSFNSKEISRATGFFYNRKGQDYLVTNWHVLSGRNAETGRSLDEEHLCIPNEIQFELHVNPIGTKLLTNKFPLFHDENTNWFQHPLGQKVDLACMRISNIAQSVVLYDATSKNSAVPLTHEVGSDCFVVGFPLSHNATRDTVVWKRATVATEFELKFNSLPCFLIDATTSSGMSGSPVFLRQSGNVRYSNGNMEIFNGMATEFIGVYSGRYLAKGGTELNLGYVWKRFLIDEMIDNSVVGSYDLRP